MNRLVFSVVFILMLTIVAEDSFQFSSVDVNIDEIDATIVSISIKTTEKTSLFIVYHTK